MGQAFRRASGWITSSPSTSSSKAKIVVDHVAPIDEVKNLRTAIRRSGSFCPQVNRDNVLEECDPLYDLMLGQMLGRVKTKPGGKPERGEKLYNYIAGSCCGKAEKTNAKTVKYGRYEERTAPPGTLNVARLRHIMLLHQGKADDRNGPMDAKQIAEKFKIDVVQVQTVL